MGRQKRKESETGIYHWYNRGITRKRLFHYSSDFGKYRRLVAELARRFEIEIYHYCIMPNHSHLLFRCGSLSALSDFSHLLMRRYAYFYQKTYQWSGQVFERNYKTVPIESVSYLLECGRYIELNPVRARLASMPEDYDYSSFAHYAGLKMDPVVTHTPEFDNLGVGESACRQYYYDYVTAIRSEECDARQKLYGTKSVHYSPTATIIPSLN